jgi:hypothetical protein
MPGIIFVLGTHVLYGERLNFLRSKKFVSVTANTIRPLTIVSRKFHFPGWDRNFCSSLTGKINFLLGMPLLKQSLPVKPDPTF